MNPNTQSHYTLGCRPSQCIEKIIEASLSSFASFSLFLRLTTVTESSEPVSIFPDRMELSHYATALSQLATKDF